MISFELIAATIYLLMVGLSAWMTIAQFIEKACNYSRDDQPYTTPLIPLICKAIWPMRRVSDPTWDILKCTILAWLVPFIAAVTFCTVIVLIRDCFVLIGSLGRRKSIS